MVPRFVAALLWLALSLVALVPRLAEAAPAAAAPIRVGLLPTIATLTLLKLYDPLRQHLQQSLGRPVELYTATSFEAFLGDIKAGEFDVIVTAPHFGVVAYDIGYVPLFRYKLELRPLMIVPVGSNVREPGQLRGKRILTADRLTALSVVAETWLHHDFQMRAGKDYALIEASNHATAIRAVAIGEADAAISSLSVLRQVPEDIRAKVENFPCGLSVPHQFTMAHARLSPRTVEALRAALADFEATELGKGFFKAGGFQGLVPLEAGDIERARPYADVLDTMIRSGN
jgi:phosphonate transport system substrate-binding protein